MWLSSQQRTISDKPPVRSSREIAGGEGAELPQDQAAAAGDEEHPPTGTAPVSGGQAPEPEQPH